MQVITRTIRRAIISLAGEGTMQNISKRDKRAHHMWSAEREDGKLKIRRTKHADEEEMFQKKRSRRIAKRTQDQADSAMACLGIWAATCVDDELLTREIAQPIVARFNTVRPGSAPRVHTWAELNQVVGAQKFARIRAAITDGIRTRFASKLYNVPFLIAAELIDRLDGIDMNVMRKAIAGVKAGDKTASRKYGSVVHDIKSAFAKFGGMKLAIDDKAKRYFEDYFGPYGQELVADIQRRVRADLAYIWLSKRGVDEAAAEYWSSYFSEGGYGALMVGDIARKLSPANSNNDDNGAE